LKRGITLGKYAPLHRGHQLVIETGLSEMDEMIVIIYDSPETTRLPLGLRSGWIRSLYPTVQIIAATRYDLVFVCDIDIPYSYVVP
jgi:phosphopantetheine adenylyltransferase